MGASLLNFFVQIHVLVAVGALLSLGLRALGRIPAFPLKARSELTIHYALFAMLCVLAFIPAGREGESQFRSFAKVVEVNRPFAQPSFEPPPVAIVFEGGGKGMPALPLAWCAYLALAFLFLGLAASARDLFRLRQVLSRSLVIRKIGRVRLAVLEEEVSPFSAHTFKGAWVILPSSLFSRPFDLRIAIAHELQHHRQRDALWCHLMAPLRALCYFHPLRVLWGVLIAEIQELACDEALVSQKKQISPGDYARCLVSAAETAGRKGAGRAYAAAPAFFSERRILKRRIESMYTTKKEKRWLGWTVGIALGLCLGASTWASGRWLAESKVTRAEAERMAEQARGSGDFPITVNDAVLEELNWYLGTEKGRARVRKALANLELLRPRFDRILAEHRAPEELLAVGFIESAYQNLPSSANQSSGAAGIWQFIAGTARVFGMRVDAQVDERMDIDKETDAAVRYLLSNKLRFNDWLLGVMAYNMGERAVDNAIKKTGSRDAWELVKWGFENDTDYLPKFMAALLILKNPDSVK